MSILIGLCSKKEEIKAVLPEFQYVLSGVQSQQEVASGKGQVKNF